ncbi:MAG: hypothetical protein V4697_02435 [Patescibacteria group bacterium]
MTQERRRELAEKIRAGSLKRLYVRGQQSLAVPWCTVVFKEIRESTVTPSHGYWILSLPRGALRSSDVDFVAQSLTNSSHELEFSDAPF